MNILDKFIAENAEHPGNLEQIVDLMAITGEDTSKLMVITIKDLEQLRPYLQWHDGDEIPPVDKKGISEPLAFRLYNRQEYGYFAKTAPDNGMFVTETMEYPIDAFPIDAWLPILPYEEEK